MTVQRLAAVNQFLAEFVVQKTLLKEVDTPLGRFAMDALARKDPLTWDRKNKVPAPRRVKPELADGDAGAVAGKTSRQVHKEEQAAIAERNAAVAKMRKRGNEE